MRPPVRLPVVLLIALIAAPVAAQEPEKLEIKADEFVEKPTTPEDPATGRPPGLTGRLQLGGTLNFSDNRSVIGQTDGSTFTFGFKLDSAVDYNHEAHEWRNTLLIQEGLTKIPVIDDLVKSADTVDFNTIYLYHVAEWWGPFVRFAMQTSAFRGHDVRPEPVSYLVSNVDQTQETIVADRLSLTDPFKPFRFKESLGAFLRASSNPMHNLEFRLGVGARETLAEGQFAVTDDEATADVVEVTGLDDSYAIGAEGAAEFWGALSEDRVNYRLGAEVLVPFATSDLPPGDERTKLDLTMLELGAALSFGLVEWATLDYELKVVREPLLIDEFQVQNNLLLTFGVNYGPTPEAAEGTE